MSPKRDRHPKLFDPVSLMVALASAGMIEALHGHECTGDVCILCFISVWASGLLATSLGVFLTRPILRLFSKLRVVRLLVCPRLDVELLAHISTRSERVEMTPVTLGVKLLI